jgi:hypothetical protein
VIDSGDVIDGPDINPAARYLASFAALDTELPLALLPVRIETRYIGGDPPSELLVRVFPDLIHADLHDPLLTASEQDLAKAFWRQTWRAGNDVAAKDQAFAWLAEQTGPWRAAWVATEMTPRNQEDAPTTPVPPEKELVPPPRFPSPDAAATGRPVYAKLLPTRWVVVAMVNNEAIGTWVGAEIPETLVMAPGLADGGDVDGQGLLDAQELKWTHDVDEAERVGMLVRIDLDQLGKRQFDSLLVVGINLDRTSDDVEALLDAHRYTHGLDLIPQGTATNATETVVTPWHPSRPDLAAVRASELDPRVASTRPDIASDGDLFRMLGADAVSVGLGLGGNSTFDLSLHAGIPELPQSEAMNRVIWPATFGHYLTSPLAGVIDDDGMAWLRDWATAFVRGGGPLPTMLVGAQPYGVIPACSIPPNSEPVGNIELVEHTIGALAHDWNDAIASVPRIDPSAADINPEGDTDWSLAAVVAQVMGTVPHPTGLHLRHVDGLRSEYNAQFGGDLLGIGFRALAFFDGDGNAYGDSPHNYAMVQYRLLQADLETPTSPEGQLNDLEMHRDNFLSASAFEGIDFDVDQLNYLEELGATIRDDMIPLVAAHIERLLPIRNAIRASDLDPSGTIGDDDDPQLFFSIYADAGEEQTWNSPLVADGVTADAVAELTTFLTGMRSRVASAQDSEGGYDEDKPLLHHLVNRSADLVSTQADRDLLLAGLDGLIEITTTDPDAVATIERLLRESIGIASYRLDAWFTAVASWRLENKRAKKPHGLQVGAYGFVVDLRKREGRGSQGYVMAPSLSLATTAAVLRSGWAAFGGETETSGLAVDLSSDRVRRAQWLADGVRRGQDLAELLGARFERRLHDAGLDRWVKPFRELVLEVSGKGGAPNAIVDGLFLARGHGGGPELTETEDALADMLPGWLAAAERPTGDPTGVLDDLIADLDATADAAVTQAVFSLVEGNTPETMATFSGATSGDIELPRLRFADSPRPATTITHRLAATIDAAAVPAWPGADISGRALAAPSLESWVERLLGSPREMGFEVAVTAPNGTVTRRLQATIADVGLAALDVLFLTPAGEATGLGRLGEVIAGWAELNRPDTGADDVLVIDANVGDPSLTDVVTVARSLRSMIAAATDLDARTFAESGAVDLAAGVDVADLLRRAEAVAVALRGRRDELAGALATTSSDNVRRAILRLSGFELPGGYPAVTDDAVLVAMGKRLVTVIDKREAAVATLIESVEADWPTFTDDQRRAHLDERLKLLVGQSFPWAPHFSVAAGTDLATNFGRRRADRTTGTAWLSAAGRVDPGADRLRTAVDLVEAVRDATTFDWNVAQFPDHADEEWAALRRPTVDGRGRVCVLTAGGQPDPTRPMAGLAFSSWTEALPVEDQMPAVALHFDAPSSRAAQAVILCVANPTTGFSFDVVRGIVSQTLLLAQRRMVGLETLQGIGQYVPAIYLPDGLEPGVAS